MIDEKGQESSLMLAEAVIKGIQEKKGKEIVKIDISKLSGSVCDYFVICHGTSQTHVQALADSVEEEVFKTFHEKPWHKEGFQNAEWILLDFLNVVVHIFQEDRRLYYNLEDLWGDGEIDHICSPE